MVTAYRPDPVVDPEFEGFAAKISRSFGALTGEDTAGLAGLPRRAPPAPRVLQDDGRDQHRSRPSYRRHRRPLSAAEAEALFDRVKGGEASPGDAELFRAQMLTEMAAMSLDDGLVMQIHPGSFRNHNAQLFAHFGRDKGADIPTRTDYVHALKPLLDRFGNERDLSIILFTLDESSYARELAPLAGPLSVPQAGPGVVVSR